MGWWLISDILWRLIFRFAMSSSPVSYVAPMRECSVLIGTFMGARFLAEKHSWRRLGSACVILAGIILLAIG